ncbi:hypothetical protein BT96DRAFT_1022926 [Gymnopus androsaceus JB14]|uniref:Uncharacterized protein n=1 Tax=Gymnopus androsaceus JB14 TaxID=1447944 RepID=A0A6A4H904_9AGAR|nr:hypothetical protein BT96DRAFT_1022926 [Gymnopus androsaceus JB14]
MSSVLTADRSEELKDDDELETPQTVIKKARKSRSAFSKGKKPQSLSKDREKCTYGHFLRDDLLRLARIAPIIDYQHVEGSTEHSADELSDPQGSIRPRFQYHCNLVPDCYNSC